MLATAVNNADMVRHAPLRPPVLAPPRNRRRPGRRAVGTHACAPVICH